MDDLIHKERCWNPPRVLGEPQERKERKIRRAIPASVAATRTIVNIGSETDIEDKQKRINEEFLESQNKLRMYSEQRGRFEEIRRARGEFCDEPPKEPLKGKTVSEFVAASKPVSQPVIPAGFVASKKVNRRGPEYEIQAKFVKTLGEFKQFVKTPGGIADVVTNDAIYEVKKTLTTRDLHHAIGQLISYSHLSKGKELFIVTEHNPLGQVAIDICQSIGITIIEFKG